MTASPQSSLRRCAVVLAALIAVFAVFVLTRRGQVFDDTAKLFTTTHGLGRRFNRWGLPMPRRIATTIAVGAGVVALASVLLQPRARRKSAFLAAAAVIAPAVAIAELLKPALPRQPLSGLPAWIGASTFPSGHVAFVTACAFVAYLGVPIHRRSVAAVACVMAAFAIQVAVVFAAMHRPSDALGGSLIALAWGSAMLPWCAHEEDQPPIRPQVRAERIGGAAAVIVLLGLAIAAVTQPQRFPTRDDTEQAFVAALLLFLGFGGAGFLVLERWFGQSRIGAASSVASSR